MSDSEGRNLTTFDALGVHLRTVEVEKEISGIIASWQLEAHPPGSSQASVKDCG